MSDTREPLPPMIEDALVYAAEAKGRETMTWEIGPEGQGWVTMRVHAAAIRTAKAEALRAVRDELHRAAPWPNPEWLMTMRVWLDGRLAALCEENSRGRNCVACGSPSVAAGHCLACGAGQPAEA